MLGLLSSGWTFSRLFLFKGGGRLCCFCVSNAQRLVCHMHNPGQSMFER